MTPNGKRVTLAQFHDLGDLGLFEGRGAMLIDGVIVERGQISSLRAVGIELTSEALRAAFGRGWLVSEQKPLVVGPATDPVPDVAVFFGSPRTMTSHPTTAALVVEVADTSFKYDTTTKLTLYSAGGIAEYWVLDVNARQLHVFRDPGPSADGAGYAAHLVLGPTDTVAPLMAPAAAVRVSDLLP
jgi:Uma2 family endonuclease